jgi:hypothetical protein
LAVLIRQAKRMHIKQCKQQQHMCLSAASRISSLAAAAAAAAAIDAALVCRHRSHRCCAVCV